MDQQSKQRRVSFSDIQQGKFREYTKSRDITKTGSFKEVNTDEENIKKMRDYDGKESEFAATIAAAAYAICSLEEIRVESERKMVESFRESFRDTQMGSFGESFRDAQTGSFRESFRRAPTTTYTNDQGDTFQLPDLGRSTRRSSSLERRDKGEGIRRSFTTPVEVTGPEQRADRRVETKADAWERARMAKINKWYEKMNNKIIEWENEKKKRAGHDMESRKVELERLKRVNLHHYTNKIDWIENVSGGARKQLEEKKKSEEAYVKQRAKKITATGKVPVQCLCFEY